MDTIEFLEPLPTVAKSGPDAPMTDYNKIMQRVGIKKWVEEKGVKEVWIWGYHGGVVGLWESNMAGPFGDISNSNRDPKDLPVLSKTYTVYHYNYQRGTSEAVEDHIHQIEAVLNFVDGRDRTPPEQWPSLLFWGKFVGSDRTHKIVHPGCGWAHYPPNAEQDYDWANKRFVETDIEDWKPDGTGKKQRMNCDRWGGDSLKWFVYWMQNIPGADNGLILQGQAAEQLVGVHRGLRYGDEAEDDAGGEVGDPDRIASQPSSPQQFGEERCPIPGSNAGNSANGRSSLRADFEQRPAGRRCWKSRRKRCVNFASDSIPTESELYEMIYESRLRATLGSISDEVEIA